jgi:hypothetical protein
MNILLNLNSLPELQRLDKQRRGRAIRDWHIELWKGAKGWTVYLLELGIFISVFAAFRALWHFVGVHWSWYGDFVWLLPAALIAVLIRNQFIYLRRRDVLAKILERPDYAS